MKKINSLFLAAALIVVIFAGIAPQVMAASAMSMEQAEQIADEAANYLYKPSGDMSIGVTFWKELSEAGKSESKYSYSDAWGRSVEISLEPGEFYYFRALNQNGTQIYLLRVDASTAKVHDYRSGVWELIYTGTLPQQPAQNQGNSHYFAEMLRSAGIKTADGATAVLHDFDSDGTDEMLIYSGKVTATITIYDVEGGKNTISQISFAADGSSPYFDYSELYVSSKNHLISGISFEDDQYTAYKYQSGKISESAYFYMGYDIDDELYITGDYDGGQEQVDKMKRDLGFDDVLIAIKNLRRNSTTPVRNDTEKILAMTTSTPTSISQTATPTASKVLVNGANVAFDAYNIGGNNYFKLRDLAYTLSGTEAQFEVGWDGTNNAIKLTSGSSYTAVGGEMSGKGSGNQTAAPTTSKIFLDGRQISLTAYNIGGNNYFKLRDIGIAFDFDVTWDSARNTIVIDTGSSYTPD